MVLGIVVPFALLGWASRSRGAVLASSGLIILGVFTAKSVTLVAGQALPFLQAQASYTPTFIEAGGVIGVAGLAGLIYLLGKRFLPQK
jgi:Ni/Fe-hydrogenase subunit HybB-like protein